MKPRHYFTPKILPGIIAATAMITATFPAAASSPEGSATEESLTVTDTLQAAVNDTLKVNLSASDLFVNAPMSIFPTIDPMTRMDMIDYFRAGSEKASKNLIGGDCRIIEDTPDKLVFMTSDVSEYLLALLPSRSAESGKIIMLSRTLKTPAEDSSVSFYDTAWKKLEGVFTMPSLEQWILPEAKKNRKDIENAVPFIMAKIEYSPDSQSMTLTNKLPDYLPEEYLKVASPSIRESMTFRWNGKRFIFEKQSPRP